MKGTAEDVLKAIPDFEEFLKLTEEISGLMYKKLVLDAEIRDSEAGVFKTANTDEKYFQGGKPPSATFVDNTYKFSGFDGEILPKRIELAGIISSLEAKKLQLDVYKQMVEIWRTLSSNSRSTSF